MKILLPFLLLTFISYGQPDKRMYMLPNTGTSTGDTEMPCENPDVQPVYPGGQAAMQKYMSDNIKYPKEAIQNHKQGTVYVQYIVEKDGSLSHVAISRGVSKSLNDEAMRVVSAMPNWFPGMCKGDSARVHMRLPVRFRFDQ